MVYGDVSSCCVLSGALDDIICFVGFKIPFFWSRIRGSRITCYTTLAVLISDYVLLTSSSSVSRDADQIRELIASLVRHPSVAVT
jgi:hypothetical protein